MSSGYNEGRLDVNVGHYCTICSYTVLDGQPSERYIKDGARLTRHVACRPTIGQPRDSRGRFVSRQANGYVPIDQRPPGEPDCLCAGCTRAREMRIGSFTASTATTYTMV